MSQLWTWAAVSGFTMCLLVGAALAQAPRAPPNERVARGRYLIEVASCADCHTPMRFDEGLGAPLPDSSRLLSGHPKGAGDPAGQLGKGDQLLVGPTFTSFRLPFGTVYSANLTPHSTGLGDWTEAMFIAALRTGKHLGVESQRAILPPMPWPNTARLTDEDLRAMWAYLRSIPPIDNPIPKPAVDPKALEQQEKVRSAILQSLQAGREAKQAPVQAPPATTPPSP